MVEVWFWINSPRLQHANIVSVTDIGMADTASFIVMEYVDGANLKTILDSMRRQGRAVSVGSRASPGHGSA